MVVLFINAWLVSSLHNLFLHHEHPVCEAAHDGAHLHDERYAGDNCSLCAFVHYVPEIPALSSFFSLSAKLPDSEAPCFYRQPFCQKSACDPVFRRGPPLS